MICSDENFARLFDLPGLERRQLRPAHGPPGTVDETVRRLNARLPPDVRALSRGRAPPREKDYWVNQTSTGKIFAFGVAGRRSVAAVVIYQVLSNDVRDHLPEYATLKAMGYTNASSPGSSYPGPDLHADGLRCPPSSSASPSTGRPRPWPNIPMRMTSRTWVSLLV